MVEYKHPGALTDLGYHASLLESARHMILGLAVKRYKKKAVVKMLNEQVNLRKHEESEEAIKDRKAFLDDLEWVKGNY